VWLPSSIDGEGDRDAVRLRTGSTGAVPAALAAVVMVLWAPKKLTCESGLSRTKPGDAECAGT
jgi:hypothetical protein